MERINQGMSRLAAVGATVLLAHAAHALPSGAPGQLTDGPADIGNCTVCHMANTGNGSAEILGLPAGGYAPGATYDLAVRISDDAQVGAGFSISAQDNIGGWLGTMIVSDATNTQLAAPIEPASNYLGHTQAGYEDSIANWAGNGNSYNFNFQWQAPPGDAGTVTFYVAAQAVNGATSDGDNQYFFNVALESGGNGGAVPAVSTWGVIVMLLLLAAGGTLVFRAVAKHRHWA
ncbi:MAG: choice-of-anchor V domain-containing protein [Planctomycetota bacterium]